MKLLNLQDLVWLVGKALKKLGALGIIGMVILITSLFVYSAKMLKLNAEIAESKATAAHVALQNNLSQESNAKNQAASVSKDMGAFYEHLPSAKALPTILLKVNTIAQAQHVALNIGDYKLNKAHDTQTSQPQAVSKYEVRFPVKGQYTQIRSFISQVLYELPSLALVELRFKRENTQMLEVEADLMFVVFVKE